MLINRHFSFNHQIKTEKNAYVYYPKLNTFLMQLHGLPVLITAEKLSQYRCKNSAVNISFYLFGLHSLVLKMFGGMVS